MVTKTLGDEQIRAGESVVKALDAGGVVVDAAFWYLFEDAGWTLVLSLPEFETAKPSAAYDRIFDALKAHPVEGISVSNIAVAKSGNLALQLLRVAIQVPGPGTVRFTNNVVNGHLVQDALIYRMLRSPLVAGAARVVPAPVAPGTTRSVPAPLAPGATKARGSHGTTGKVKRDKKR